MKLILFGTGEYYEKRKKKINEIGEIVAFIDNNSQKWGKMLDGAKIYSPTMLKMLTYDYIVIMSSYMSEMKEDLLSLSIQKEKIRFYDEIIRSEERGNKLFYINNQKKRNKGSILIFTTQMNYGGGSIVAIYAAQALISKGYNVVIATPEINNRFFGEIRMRGIDVIIWKSLPYIFSEDYQIIQKYDYVIVNVFQMIKCAYEICRIKPTLWWIHESSNAYSKIYANTQCLFNEISNPTWMRQEQLCVVGVSDRAKKIFNSYYPNIIVDTLTFGIPDCYKAKTDTDKQKTILAVIANICEIKGQKILLKAYSKLSNEYKEKCEIWFIGKDPLSVYSQEVKQMAKDEKGIIFLGEMTREMLYATMLKIDGIVCPSLEETMSMSIVEGLMMGKICVTTDHTGISQYIKNEENGFICEAGNIDDMYNVLKKIIENGKTFDNICENARNTYKSNFTMSIFGNRLEHLLRQIKDSKLDY